jgi:hypothetical protein
MPPLTECDLRLKEAGIETVSVSSRQIPVVRRTIAKGA